jgi:hypothetical protein
MLEFTGHVIVGVVGFILVTTAGVAVYAYASYIEHNKLAPEFVIYILGFLGDGLFILDVAGFATILLAEFIKLVLKVIDSLRSSGGASAPT